MNKINDERKYFLEFLTKNPEEYISRYFSLVARMKRLSNYDCRSIFDVNSPVVQYIDDSVGELASEINAEEINNILWNTFNTEISHLLSCQELKEKIKLGQITIHKTNNHIDAILQSEIMPKKFYINQIVNKTEKKIIHAMLLNRLKEYINNGGKYLYSWVEENNIASIKFHEKYGMKHDGMWSMIYVIER